MSDLGRRARRPVVTEEQQMLDELSALPDDEGMQQEVPSAAGQHLGKRRRLEEVVQAQSVEGASEEDSGDWQAAAMEQEGPRRRPREPAVVVQQAETQHLRRRARHDEDLPAAPGLGTGNGGSGPQPAPGGHQQESAAAGRSLEDVPAPRPAPLPAPGRLPPPPSRPPQAPPPAPPTSQVRSSDLHAAPPQPAAAPKASGASLFGELPQPEHEPEPAARASRGSTQPAAASRSPSPAPSPAAPPTAHASTSPSPAPPAGPAAATSTAAAAPGPTPQGDQVAAALLRLTGHIGNPAKFAKAAPLLRQLLGSGTLGKQHRGLAFDAVRAVFSLQPGRHKHLVDPVNRREAMKLTAAIEALATAGYFKTAERAQISQVYHLLGVTCNEMQTDDSFVFSKVLSKVREAVDQLPEREPGSPDPEEVAAYQHVTQDKHGSCSAPAHSASAATLKEEPLTGAAAAGAATTQQQQQPAAEPAAQPEAISAVKEEKKAAAADDPFGLDAFLQPAAGGGSKQAEDDPFGLGSLMEQKAPAPPPKPKPPKVPEPPSNAWGPTELLAARRCAVLMCVQHARHTFHRHAWAQTSIELLAEHCWKNKLRFSSAQEQELDELWAWVRKARAQRKQGPSAKEINRDTTSFERARAEWGRATVSVRGKVGAQGDAKSTSWLG